MKTKKKEERIFEDFFSFRERTKLLKIFEEEEDERDFLKTTFHQKQKQTTNKQTHAEQIVTVVK
jgi:hypothetical protein